jgi:cell division transport system permease protein
MLEKDNTIRRRLTASYLTSVVSMALVLFLVGLVGMLLLNTRKLSDYVKENIGISIYLNDDIREVDVFSLQKLLDSKKYVKETRYITKEQAAQDFKKEIGEDFVSFLGSNPLPPSIDVKLHANYANPDSFAVLEKEFRKFPQVADVAYQKDLIYAVNLNVRKISLAILVLGGLLTLIALTLINNTIRLAVYSKRFIIRTMQLVGARHQLIRRPFVIRGITQGVLGACFAMGLLLLTLTLVEREINGLFSIRDFGILGILFAVMLFTGVILAWISTWLSVNKYLNMKTDNLYN